MTERHFFCKRQLQALFAVLVGLCLLCNGLLWASEQNASSAVAGHRVVSLKHISPEQGKAFLARLEFGTAGGRLTTNWLPGTTDTLLITGEPRVVQRAVAVLALVDAPEEFSIRQIGPASSLPSMPSNERIASAVGNICIGTFAQPPREAGKAKALVDVHNGSVWAIAPLFQLQDIALAVELGPQVLEQRRARAEPVVAPAAPRIPSATAIGEPASVGRAVPAEVPAALDAGNHRADSEKITRPDEMQKKLLEMRLRAAERALPGLEAASLGVLPSRLVEAERKPLALDLALAQADTNVPTSPLPEAGQDANATDDGTSGLRPGQVVPTGPDDTALAQEVPVPDMAESAVSDVAAQTMPETASYEPGGSVDDERIIDLTLKDKLPVIELLDLVGKYMNLDYIYDPAKITGEVTLKLNGNLRGSMKVKDLYLLLESVLKFKNLVMTRHKGNIVTIVPTSEALDADPILVGPGEPEVEAGDVVVTRVFELEHINTTSAQNLLDSMKLSVGVTPIAESGTLIVTAYAHRMARLEQLLSMVDKPGEPRKFRYRQLRYTMAKNLAEKVKNLAEQLESVSVTVGSGGGTTTTTLPRLPNESDVAYRQRQARQRATQAAAARRASTAAARQPAQETAKPGVYLDADERTNRILMIGVEEQLGVVDDLVDALDVEQQDLRSMKLYRIKHVDAEEVSRKLQELGIITKIPDTSTSSRITGGPRTQSQTAAAQARAAAAVAASAAMTEQASEEGPVEQPQVVVVESTNSLLVNATPEQHAQIETIISYVDSETLEDEIPYKIYPLENSSPDHLATVLQSLIQETTQNEDKEGKIVESVVKKKEDDITIVPDPNTYSLIVYASKKNQEWISNLVRQLDKRRPQVLIDVTLVEITETDAFTYDLNIIQSIPDLAFTSGLANVIQAGASAGAAAITSDTIQGKLAASDRSQFADAQWDGDQSRAFYGDKHINVLLTAMKSKNYGRVLAKPKILVNDNEPGTIKTTDTTYIEKTSSIPVSSGGAGTESTLIQTATDYAPYEAGITLDITPHISEGDLLRLDIALTRSDFLTTEDTSKPPNTTSSEVTTAVTVPDGSTVILGGLLKLNQNKGGKKVPILGDLPLLGGLFRGVNNEDRQSKLYVFVKAEVIRPEEGLAQGLEDLEKLSERNRLAFEQHEKEFQGYQSWPGVKSKPVQPERVLEAQ